MSIVENQVGRREFLVTGSLAIAGLTLPGILLSATKSPAAALPLSVGFLGEGSNVFQAAETVPTGDPTLFSRGARFSFRGMQRFPGDNINVLVDAIFHTDVGDFPFFAFTHIEVGKIVSNSSPTSFRMSVPTTGSIDFMMKVKRAASAEVAGPVSFAVNSTTGNVLKLNRGAYIFAISDRAVDWSAVVIAPGTQPSTYVSGGKPLLLRNPSGQQVNFDYVVMTVRAGS
jgi:hypothetical protein